MAFDALCRRTGLRFLKWPSSKWLMAGLLSLGLTSSAMAAEMALQDVYSVSGAYSVFHAGAGDVIGGATELGAFGPQGRNVAKAYLYWSGNNWPQGDFSGDGTITFTSENLGGTVDSVIVADTSSTIEFEKPLTPGTYFWDANVRMFVADVTQYITLGYTNYSISGFDMDAELGAGLQIVYTDPGEGGDVTIYQGNDFAYRDWPGGGELNRTNVLNHTFKPSEVDRVLEAVFFVAGGSDLDRPDQLWSQVGEHDDPAGLPSELTTGNPLASVLIDNPLQGADGDAWDTVTTSVVIPAGSTFASFQFESGGGSGAHPLPESFNWMSASFTMVPEPASLVLLALGGVSLLRWRK